MTVISDKKVLHQPRILLWRVASQFEQAPQWMDGVTKAEHVSGQAANIGGVWRVYLQWESSSPVIDFEITEWVEGERFGLRPLDMSIFEGGAELHQIIFNLKELADRQTEVTVQCEYAPRNRLAKIKNLMFLRRQYVQRLEVSLIALERVVVETQHKSDPKTDFAMNLKICLITNQYPPEIGGVGHSAHRVANLLAQPGLSVHVVAFQKHAVPLPSDESVSSTQEGEVLVHRVKVFYPNRQAETARTEAEILTQYNREMFQALDDFQRRYRYDVLHAFFLYPAGFIAGLVGRQRNVKVVASIRGNDVGKYVFDPLRLPFIGSALRNADYVTSVATNLVELADRTITPVAGKAQTIFNSIDPARLQPVAAPELNLHGAVIGTAGLFRYKKGLLYLLKALAGLVGRFDFTVLLAGDFFHEEDRRQHLQYLKDYGLSDRTVVTGKIAADRVADYLQLFDIVAFPSLFSEGCPLSMLEAMAMQKAVIGSRAGAIPEIIRDRENGLLVNPGSAEEIATAIIELIEKPDLRKRLGENAAQTISAMTPTREFREWINVYQAVLQ
jgi:glycosyltransferase involved in cell wall biosynthesis